MAEARLFQQALPVLAHLRKNEMFAQAAGVTEFSGVVSRRDDVW